MTAPRKPADRAKKQVKAKDPSKPVKVTITGRDGSAEVTVMPMIDWGYAWRNHAGDPARGVPSDYGALVEDIVDPADLAKFNASF